MTLDEDSSPPWAGDVLTFWFDELSPKDWFLRADTIDAAIAARFSTLPDEVAATDQDELLKSPKSALAAILVLDQLPRNLYRNTARAFAYDAVALRLAKGAIERGHDQDPALGKDERLFLYLPFEHSEDIADQERSVKLISALGDSSYTRYAEAHRDIIARFGRFPHRNEILGRATTEQEAEFLLQPGSSF
jgi:uncharacterized protein (DUF924 family)